MRRDVKIGVILPPGKELSEGRREACVRSFSSTIRESMTLPASWLWTSSFQKCDTENVCCWSHPFCGTLLCQTWETNTKIKGLFGLIPHNVYIRLFNPACILEPFRCASFSFLGHMAYSLKITKENLIKLLFREARARWRKPPRGGEASALPAAGHCHDLGEGVLSCEVLE